MPLIDYGMNWEELMTEECELRAMVENDCKGFCVVTNRMVKFPSMNDSDTQADAAHFSNSIMNHLMHVLEQPSPSEEILRDITFYFVKSSYFTPFVDILAPPPKG